MHIASFRLQTKERVCFPNITSKIQEYVSQSGLHEGLCIVYIPHTTAGITINESADPAVIHDIKTKLEKLVPSDEYYTHNEGNSDAHIRASLMGFNVNIPFSAGRLCLGTWQGIFFCEFDGPRQRSVFVQVIG